jgi:hypothetical protein
MRTRALWPVAALCVIAPAAQAAEITIVHGIPGFRADVYVNGVRQLSGFEAGTMTSPIKIGGGVYDVAIRPAGSPKTSKPVLKGRLRLGTAENASVVAHLDPAGKPSLTVYRNDVSAVATGKSRIVFRQDAQAPAAVLSLDGHALPRSVVNGGELAAVVRPGNHVVTVLPRGSSTPIWGPARVSLRAGTVYLVYAIGSQKQGTIDQLVQRLQVRSATPRHIQTGDGSVFARPARDGGGMLPAGLVALLGAAAVVTVTRRRPTARA